jgi:hypothetical protein
VLFSKGFWGQRPFSTPLRTHGLSGLSDEEAWFEANRIRIARQYPGMFVLVKDQAVRGAYPDFQSAFAAGTAMFGSGFLVKQALETQPTYRI